jgi:hypothetical protein
MNNFSIGCSAVLTAKLAKFYLIIGLHFFNILLFQKGNFAGFNNTLTFTVDGISGHNVYDANVPS